MRGGRGVARGNERGQWRGRIGEWKEGDGGANEREELVRDVFGSVHICIGMVSGEALGKGKTESMSRKETQKDMNK